MQKTECFTERRPVLKAYSTEQSMLYLYQPRCKRWVCPYCATINKQQWSIRITEGIEFYRLTGLKDWRFVTITSHPKNKTRSQCLHVWPKAWAKLSSRMRRQFDCLKYVLLPELHKNGRVHVHAIMSAKIETRWLKDNAPYCGLGYQGQSDKITDGYGSIAYVTKYLTKAEYIAEWPKNFRRIRTSQKWPKLENEGGFNPEILEWEYYITYYSEGLDYLALTLEEELKVPVKIL